MMESFNNVHSQQPMNTHPKHQLDEQELGYPRQDKRPRSQPLEPLRCPRCDSTNTKFCYYNNYSLSQPRYFCKGCRRYWTHGGSLRNVPVGGGCRKNRRPPSSRRNVDQCLLSTITTQLGLGDNAAATLLTENPTPNPNPNASIAMPTFFDLLMSGLLDTTNMAYGYQSLYDGQMLVPFGVVGGEEMYKNMMDLQWQVGGDANVMNGSGNGMIGMEWARDGCFGAVGSSWHDHVNNFLI